MTGGQEPVLSSGGQMDILLKVFCPVTALMKFVLGRGVTHVSPRRGEKEMPAASCFRLQEVTGGDRAIPRRKSLLPGVRGKRGRPEAGRGRMKTGGRRQSLRSTCLRPPGVPAGKAAGSRVPFRAKRSTGHGEGCDNARPGQSEQSEVCRDEAKRKKRFDKPQGQSSRRTAVVCDAPEAMV